MFMHLNGGIYALNVFVAYGSRKISLLKNTEEHDKHGCAKAGLI